MNVQKIQHHTIKASIKGLWFEYLYGDGWRLVEIVLGMQILLRAFAILFFDGFEADYYATFPGVGYPLLWGLATLAIGAGRIAGTVINGKWRRSPRLRRAVGFASFSYQGMHCFFFWSEGLTVIALGYLFWTILEAMAVIRSTIDIHRKRAVQCLSG